jgi:N-acetylglucosamine kinase-like BadF-type ATPase
MIRYLIGIDGGGTKTKMLCIDLSGRRVAKARVSGTYYRQDGISSVIKKLCDGVDELTSEIDRSETAICFGMPGYGETPEKDRAASEAIAKALAPASVCFVNDANCAWAGAFALNDGVNIVAGTGSIAFGRDRKGTTARCGGWSEFFSDEGSGYWLGKRALELFSKQSDGRLPKGPLYEGMRSHFRLETDYDIIDIVERNVARSRKNTATLQRVLLKAAKEGDASALSVYEEAVRELAAIALSVGSQLDFSGDKIPVSCTGGLFQIEDLILEPLKHQIEAKVDAVFLPPMLPPCAGAALLAAKDFIPDKLDQVKEGLLHDEQ